MKKFFKALALVLALTLVIGTIPAAAADAAYSLKWTEKKIYLGEKMGFKLDADGNKVFYKGVSKVSYAKAIKGIASKDEAKEKNVTARSTDETVVSTHNTAKKIVAEKIGDATVTYYVDGVEIGSIHYFVKKTAADTIRFGAGSETVERLHEDGKVIIGKEYNVSLPWTEEGEQVDTNKRRLTVTDKDGKAVDATKAVVTKVADKARLWTVKFLAEGDYIVLGEAYQSNAYNGTTGKVSINVTAGVPQIESVKQLTMNSFEITFNGDASLTNVNSFAPENIYYKVVDSEVPFATVKDVKKDEKDKSKVTVIMGENFRDNTTYYVNFGGVEKTFVTGGSDKDSITSFEITKTDYQINDFRTIEYTFKNAKGIDITEGLKEDVIPTFEIVSTNIGDAMIAGNTILFNEVGKTVTVKGTVGTLTDTKDFKAVAIPTSTPDGVVYSVENKAYTTATAKDMKGIANYKIGDPDVVNVFFKYKNPDGTYTYNTLNEEDITNVKAANENNLIITDIDFNASQLTLVGLKEGSATILFYKMDANGNEYPIKNVITINVQKARALSKIELTPVQSYLNLGLAGDKVTVKAILKDNYGDVWKKTVAADVPNLHVVKGNDNLVSVGETALKDSVAPNTTKLATDGEITYVIDSSEIYFKAGLDAAKKGANSTVQFNLTVSKVASNSVTVSFAEKALDKNITYIPSFDKATLDVTAKKGTARSEATLTVAMKNGTYSAGTVDAANIHFIGKTDFGNIRKSAVVSGAAIGDFVYTISKDGVVLDKTADLKDNFWTDGRVVANIDAAFNASGSAIKTAATGKYVYTFYQIEDIDAKGVVTKFSTVSQKAFLTISGDAVAYDKSVKTSKIDTTGMTAGAFDGEVYLAEINEAFEFVYDGDKYDAVSAKGTVSSNGSFYLEEVTINVKSADDKYAPNYYVVKIKVGKLVNGSNK